MLLALDNLCIMCYFSRNAWLKNPTFAPTLPKKTNLATYIKFTLLCLGWQTNAQSQPTATVTKKDSLYSSKPITQEIQQDTTRKKLLKAKLEAERFRCTYPDPKMIDAKKAAEEQFKKQNQLKN